MLKEYNSLDEVPNRRGEYLVLVDFANDSELIKLVIDYDIDEVLDLPLKGAYSYYVESMDGIIYDCCYGFKTITDMIPNIAPRLKGIK